MKISRKLLLALLLIGGIVLLAGCGSAETATEENAVEKETITIQHALGEATVEKNPERVVVFDYGTLDSLDAMGVDILGLPKSNLPTFLEKYEDETYEDVGALKEPNFEKIYELKPDVIFITARQEDSYEKLSQIAPTVYVEIDGANYMESVKSNIRLLGEIFEQEEFIEEQLTSIDSSIESLSGQVTDQNKNALIVMANDGIMSAYGAGSRFGIVHSDFGFAPVDEEIEVSKHGQSIGFEYILEKDPQHIFVIDRGAVVAGGNASAKQLFENELMKETTAYQNDRITYLNSEIWYLASGGLSGTMEMIEEVKAGL